MPALSGKRQGEEDGDASKTEDASNEKKKRETLGPVPYNWDDWGGWESGYIFYKGRETLKWDDDFD